MAAEEAALTAQWWSAVGGDVLDEIIAELKSTVNSGNPPAPSSDVRWAQELYHRLKEKLYKRLDHTRNKAVAEWRRVVVGEGGAAQCDVAAARRSLLTSAKAVSPTALTEIQDVCIRRLQDVAAERLRVPEAGMAAMTRFIDAALAGEIALHIDLRGQMSIPHASLVAYERRFGQQWIKAVTKACVANHARLEFPWKKTYLEGHADRLFANLCAFVPKITHTEFRLTAPPIDFCSRKFLPVRLNGEFTQLDISADGAEYDNMDILADYFTERPRTSARQRDQQMSPLEFWGDPEWVRGLLESHALPAAMHRKYRCPYGIELSDGLTPFVMREAIFNSKVKECTQFKPSLALTVIKMFGGTRVLDFSAGWGDRLLGAMASSATHYLAFDPNLTLKPGHTAMMDRFLAADPIRRANFSVVYQPAERGELPPDFSCDLIFTSPPFFNFEVYTDIPGQSIDQWRSVPEWLVRFLFVCLNRFWVHLEPGGHMVIHLNDARKMQICEPMCLFAEARLAGCRFAGVFGAKGGVSGKTRPLWVFKKEPVDSADLVGRRKAEAEAHLRTHFHAVHSILATVDLDQLARGVSKRSRDAAVADADSAGASAPPITEAAPKRIALAVGDSTAAAPTVTLEPLRKSHRDAVQPIVQDPRVMGWMGQGATGWPTKKVDNTFRYCEEDLALPPTERSHFYWAALHEHQVVGLVFVHNVTYSARSSTGERDPYVVPEAAGRKPYFFSILLSATVHRRGVGTLATRACIREFRKLNPTIRQLYADVHVGNTASCALLAKVGFQQMEHTVWIGQKECSRWVHPLSGDLS